MRIREHSIRAWVTGVVAAVALPAVGGLVGYRAGSSEAPTASDAVAARDAASRGADALAFKAAYARSYEDSFLTGSVVGGADAKRSALERGRSAGTVAASRRLASLATTARRRQRRRDTALARRADGARVLVVGDSLEVLTSPHLQSHLPRTKLTVNAVGGSNSLQIFRLLRESYDPAQSVVVFDAGTNDNPNYPQILAGRLAAVADLIGDRCLVVPSIHGLSVGGVGSAGKNRVVRAFAAARPGTQVPDWAHVVATRPELMQPDDLHPNLQGADVRAELIAEGVRGCLAEAVQ